jgi:hypothetical protein
MLLPIYVLCYYVHTAALNTAFFQKINDGDIAVAGMALPVAGAILGLQLLHDLAHRVVAARTGSKDLFKVPIFLPSLQVTHLLLLAAVACSLSSAILLQQRSKHALLSSATCYTKLLAARFVLQRLMRRNVSAARLAASTSSSQPPMSTLLADTVHAIFTRA